jgi:hypothetical protein
VRGPAQPNPPPKPPTPPARDRSTRPPTQTAATQTQEGLPDPAHHPTDRNRNLAVTPIKRASGCSRRTRPNPILPVWPACPALPAFPRSRQHRPLRQSKIGAKQRPTHNDGADTPSPAVRTPRPPPSDTTHPTRGDPPISSLFDLDPNVERVRVGLWTTTRPAPTPPTRHPTRPRNDHSRT